MNVLQFLLYGLIGWISVPESPKSPLACTLSVTTNPSNITICNPGETITLNAEVSGGIPQLIQWTPTAGVANPNSANTTAIANGSGVYQVTVSALSTDNLITNGDFNAGASGFTSDYIPGTGGTFGLLSLEGQYAVSTNPLLAHTNFASCNDHSPGTGNMMVVNGAGVANQDVWCQNVSVTPNTDYGFSAWIASVVSSSPAQLQFSVNGTIIGGTYTASPATCNWTEFFQVWNSGPTGMAQICIVNQNTALSGNDFAIDDIFFSEICEATATVNVTLVQTNPTWFPPNNLCAGSPPVVLNSLLSALATPGGSWTINGAPATVFNPGVLGPGIYSVRYSVGLPPCTQMQTSLIEVLPLANADWNPPSSLCATSLPINLNSLLAPSAVPGGVWRINNVISTFLDPALLGPGNHTITYAVGTPPCANMQTQVVTILPVPNGNWTPPLGLCTTNASFALNTLLNPGAQSGGTWTINGTPATIFNPATLGAGNHTVRYTVGIAPCATVVLNTITVGLTPAAPQPLCQTISQNQIVFFWPLVTGATAYVVEVLSGQTGTLSVNTFTVNNLSPGETVTIRVRAVGSGGCLSAWSTSVSCTSTSCVPPGVSVQDISPLCFDSLAPDITLSATTLPAVGGTGVWSGPGISDATAGVFDPLLAGPGVHTVRFTYTLNGCSGSDTTQVTVQSPAILDMALDTVICVFDTATAVFTGIASDTAVFVWNFNGGTVVSGTGSGPYRIIWDTPGDWNVQLIVTDGACPPDTIIRTIQVESLLAPPEIFCRTTVSSVEFYWNPQPDVSAYAVDVLSGQIGSMPSDTSFLVDNLLPGASVQIALSALSAITCPDTSAQRTCIAQDCPEVNITLQTPPPICLLPNTGIVQLTAQVTGGPGTGVGNWQGTGILDTLAGTFYPTSALNGDNFITYTYTEGNCVYSAEATIRVNHRPTSFFELDSAICQNQTATLIYTGTAPPSATFFWNLNGGTVISGSGIGPIVVSWPTPGIKVVRLVVENEGCTSVPFFQQIQVDPLVEIPLIQCIQTLNSVEFFWNDVPGASAYVINLIQGPIGMITSDTSYLMSNLLPEQPVVIQLTTVSNNLCPGNVQISNCEAAACPEVVLDAPAVFTCFDGMPDTLQLNVSATGGTGNGAYTWSGEGIFNGQQNLFLTNAGMTGRTIPVAILYQEGACNYRDTLEVQVNPVPTPDFVIGGAPCENAETTVTYTGISSPQAVFMWDFGVDAVVTGTATGPYQVSWPDAGMKNIRLQIEDSGCTSTLLEQTIEVIEPLVPPVISCEATYTEITFTWQPTPGATNFEVNVLDGIPGTLTSDTTYFIQNLQPGDPVTLEVVMANNGPCPPVATQLTCETDLCPAVALTIDPVLPICYSGAADTLDLTFTLSGDSPQGILEWSGAGIFDANIPRVALSAGMIGQPNTLTATYRESVCVYTDDIPLEIRAIPIAAFTTDPLICSSNESTVTFNGSATGSATYNWNFDTGQAMPGTGAGPHQVQWTNAGQYDVSLWIADNGCFSDTFSLTVQVDEPLLPPTLSCTPDYDNMTVVWSAVTGADNYDLQLPAGVSATALSDTSVAILNLQPGTSLNYTLTALGNTICGPVSVSGSCTTPLCPPRSLSWSTTPVICRGGSISIAIDLLGNGNTPWQVAFSDGVNTTNLNLLNDTTLQFSPVATTTYSITGVTDPLLTICDIGLPGTLTVVVNAPVEAGVTVSAPEFCIGETGLVALGDLLQGEDAGGVWTEISTQPSTGGAFNAAAGAFNIAGQAARTYRFRYTLTALAPCVSDFAEVSVIIHPTPVADAGADQSLDCATAIAPLGGPQTTLTPGLTYQWQSNNGATVAQPAQPLTTTTQAGSFTLIVVNPATGCRDEDLVVINNSTNSLTLSAQALNATCLNAFGSIVVDSVTGGDLPYVFSLNNAPFVAQQVFSGLTPGDYTLTAQDATGCITETNLRIEAATELAVELIAHLAEEPYTIDLGESADLTALVNIPQDQVQSVRWNPDTLGCAGCLEQTVRPFYTTAYAVTVTDVNGCTASDDLLLYVRRERDVFIPNVFSPNGDGLNDVFMVFAGQQVQKIRSFLVFTRWGESIFQANNFQPNDPVYGWNGVFRNQKMNSGVYVYFAEVEYIDGEVVLFKGDVVLME